MSVLDPKKDADGFLDNHPDNVNSPVLSAVKMMLDDTKIEAKNLSAGYYIILVWLSKKV